jgi:hypothetical protein
VVELYLASSDGSPVTDASWFYSFRPLESYRRVMETRGPSLMRAGAFESGPAEAGGLVPEREGRPSVFRLGDSGGEPGGLKLALASGSYVLADVMAAGVVGGRRCYAQTGMLLFGDSEGAHGPRSNAAGYPAWPTYGFGGSGDLYWPQTGQTFTLTAKGADWSPEGPLHALGAKGPVKGAWSQAPGGAAFTPAHDPELSRQSSAATKPVYIVGALRGGGAVAYTFYVHRSRYAAQSLPLGLALAGAAFLAAGLGILAAYARGRAARHASQAV